MEGDEKGFLLWTPLESDGLDGVDGADPVVEFVESGTWLVPVDDGIHSQVSGTTTRIGESPSLSTESWRRSRFKIPIIGPEPDSQVLAVKRPWPLAFFIQAHIDCHGCWTRGKMTKMWNGWTPLSGVTFSLSLAAGTIYVPSLMKPHAFSCPSGQSGTGLSLNVVTSTGPAKDAYGGVVGKKVSCLPFDPRGRGSIL